MLVAMIICLRGQDNSCYGCFAVKIYRTDAEKTFIPRLFYLWLIRSKILK